MSSNEPFIYRIKPLYYIHVLDTRTSCTRLVTGPLTFTRQDNESVVFGPEQMVIIPPRHYAVIANPVVRDKKGEPTLDKNGNFKIHHGADEMRWEQEPFPLYPGEKLNGAVTPLSKWVIAADSALRLRAYRDFIDGKEKRVAGQEWLFLGPGTYTPRVDVGVVSTGKAYIVKPQTALRLRAWQECVDVYGQKRKVGEEWLVREPGAYLPRVYEEFVAVVNGHVLTEHTALHLRATRTAVDVFGKKRKAGEEWLVTVRDAESYVCDVNEELVATTRLTTLTSLQYCVVLDPYDEASGAHRLGQKEVRRGICSFFLRPGERLEAGIQAVHVLSDDEALLIRAREATTVKGVKYAPGDRWLEHGPTDYVPPVQVEILERRKAVPLDVNEGVYVRDVGTGKVRLVTGQSYLLAANEELWAKEVPKAVEELLVAHGAAPRGKSDMVCVRMPHNTVMQVYDYKEKRQRVVWGPELVMLGPDEQFSVLSLSGETPKRPHVVKALWLDLGPGFMSDVVTVETTDHARLSLRLSYTWHFDVRPGESGQGGIFQVPDFIGDACKAIASKIRAAVALSSFDAFHKNFARIIRTAVFGADAASGRAGQRLFFDANRLAITNVDIESVEPIDQRTRDSLQKSVQLAIEITTKSQEAVAKHEAERLEQEARATLERERLGLDSAVEKSRKGLKEQQALNSAVESSGHATAEAKARAAALEIEGQSSVKVAQMRAEASMISATAGLAQKEAQQEAEVAHLSACNNLEISKKEELSQIEAGKFKSIVDAIGSGTIAAIARAGPEMQAKLLHGLGLKSLLVSDGHTPVNLFSAAGGLIAQGADAKAADAKTADKKKEAAPAPVKEAN